MANGNDDWYNNLFSFGQPDNLMQGSNRYTANPNGLPTSAGDGGFGDLFSGFGMQDAIGIGGLYLGDQGLRQAKKSFDFEKGIKQKQLGFLEKDRLENEKRRENLRNIRF